MPLSFRAAVTTDVGTVRTNNEDAALTSPHLIAIADGMGGHAAGEVASGIAIDQLARLLDEHNSGQTELSTESIRNRLIQARSILRAMSIADPELAGMGTTVVGLAITPEGMVLAHIGDSRLYRLRDGELVQLTVDHTHVQHLVEVGRLRPEDVYDHPFRSVILRSLDDTTTDVPDVEQILDVEAGDRILLCSDGLSDYLREDVIRTALGSGSPTDAADQLVAAALEAATRDNVTALVADIEEDDPATGDLPESVRLGVLPRDMMLLDDVREHLEGLLAREVASGGVELEPRDLDDADDDADEVEQAVAAQQVSEPGSPEDSPLRANAAQDLGFDTDPDAAADLDVDGDTSIEPCDGHDGDDAETPTVEFAESAESAEEQPRNRPTSADLWWISLVVVAFLATAGYVWISGS